MTTLRTVSIIGAGQMGAGIAQTVALGGYEVRLYDIDADRLPTAVAGIAASLSRHVARGGIDQAQADAALARIATTDVLTQAASADLIIEAAVEDEAVKKAVFTGLLPHLGPDTLLALSLIHISEPTRPY